MVILYYLSISFEKFFNLFASASFLNCSLCRALLFNTTLVTFFFLMGLFVVIKTIQIPETFRHYWKNYQHVFVCLDSNHTQKPNR